MKTIEHSTSKFIIVFPNHWEGEETDNIISIYEPKNGYGALQFSFYFVYSEINLIHELEDYIKDRNVKYNISDEGTYVCASSSDDNDNHCKYWMFKLNNLLIFASYNCAIEDSGKEDKEINEIIKLNFVSRLSVAYKKKNKYYDPSL